MKMMLSEIAQVVQGALYGEDIAVSDVCIDTRTIKAGDLYIAIKGENFDGHDFVKQAESQGAKALIVNQAVDTEIPHVVVKDTRLALAELSGAWRRKAGASVIGITGSNGKTTIKELTAAILAVNDSVLFTQGNLNNDIGVPLTLLRLNEKHRYAVIEMGANHPGEIKYSSGFAQAEVAVISNVGAAHIEGFGSVEGVARAKGEIIESLPGSGVAILNRDDIFFDYWQKLAGNRKVISFGLTDQADVRASEIETDLVENNFITGFLLNSPAGSVNVQLKLAGKHNVLNALAASSACLALGIKLEQIKQGLESVRPVTGRLQALRGRKGNLVIDDTYNANPSSLAAGLDVLSACQGLPCLVLGAFGEMGKDSKQIHMDMGKLIKSRRVKRLWATGADTEGTVQAFGQGGRYFENQADLISALEQELNGNETILVKGSRAQHMEKVVETLVENYRK